VAKTRYHTAASIDGFIADPGNSLDWLLEIGSGDEADGRFGAFMAGPGWAGSPAQLVSPSGL
jgi:hypothetical protein